MTLQYDMPDGYYQGAMQQFASENAVFPWSYTKNQSYRGASWYTLNYNIPDDGYDYYITNISCTTNLNTPSVLYAYVYVTDYGWMDIGWRSMWRYSFSFKYPFAHARRVDYGGRIYVQVTSPELTTLVNYKFVLSGYRSPREYYG